MDLETSQALLSMQRIILVNSGTNVELKVCKCCCCSKNEDKVQDRKELTSSKNETQSKSSVLRVGYLKISLKLREIIGGIYSTIVCQSITHNSSKICQECPWHFLINSPR